MSRKIVFLDIDGTLTDFSGHLPASAEKALREARDHGNELVICTGRTFTQIYPWLLDMNLFSGVVCGAGSDIRYNGKIVFQHFIDTEHLRALLQVLDQENAFYCLQCSTGVYATSKFVHRDHPLFAGDSMTMKERERLFGKTEEVEDPASVTNVNKLCFYEAETDLESIQKDVGEYFYVTKASFQLTNKLDGEITVSGYNKAFGMQKFLEAAGGTLEDTIAFGDGPNDYEMLNFAHVGVAMGNGQEALKKQADMVTDRIDENGLANAFRKLGLIEK